MAAECDIVLEIGVVTDTQRQTMRESLQSIAIGTTFVLLAVSAITTDTASAQSYAPDVRVFALMETASAASFVTQETAGKVSVLEQGRAESAIVLTMRDTVISQATASSFAGGSTPTIVTESATATSLVGSFSESTSIIVDSARAGSAFLANSTDTVIDAAQAASLVSASATATSIVSESAHAESFIGATGATSDLIEETAIAGDALEGANDARQVVIEWAGATGEAFHSGDGAIWTCCTETLGMSQLLFEQMDSAAQINGWLYGVGEAGLYVFDGDPESAHATTGLTDFGSPAMKRAESCYLGFSGGPVEVEIETTGNAAGEIESNTYPMNGRDAAAASAGKVPIGKGLRSRYWRFTVKAASSPFGLHDLKAVISDVSRRV